MVVQPSFAEWQASRGIVPWTARAGVRAAAAVITPMFEALAEGFRQLGAQLTAWVTSFGVGMADAYNAMVRQFRLAFPSPWWLRPTPMFHVEHWGRAVIMPRQALSRNLPQ